MTVYPAPVENAEPGAKKRKLKAEESTNGVVTNDTQFARYPNVFHANKHLAQVHAEVRKQCDELALNCVSKFGPLMPVSQSHSRCLQDKVKLWINLSMPRYAGT